MRTALSFLALLLFSRLLAQDAETISWRPQAIAMGGIHAGESGLWPQVQLLGGARNKRWQVLGGLGLDPYRERSLPLLVQGKYQVFSSEKAPQPYVQGQYHLAWPGPENEGQTHEGGWGYEAGMYLRLGDVSAKEVFMQLGYAHKRHQIMTTTPSWMPWPASQRYDYDFRRISLRVGVGLW